MDLIDREKLVQEIKSQSNRLCLGNISTSDIDVEDIVQLIVDAPTVDAEPVRHGKWIVYEVSFAERKATCSCCKQSANYNVLKGIQFGKLPYCQFYGAKMDGE